MSSEERIDAVGEKATRLTTRSSLAHDTRAWVEDMVGTKCEEAMVVKDGRES
jgi:hypothetical protein